MNEVYSLHNLTVGEGEMIIWICELCNEEVPVKLKLFWQKGKQVLPMQYD